MPDPHVTPNPPSPEDVLVAVRDMAVADSAQEVEARALATARSVLDVDAAAWLDVHGDKLQVRAVSGLIQPEAHQDLRMGRDTGLSGLVLARDEPVAAADYLEDTSVDAALRELLKREGIASLAGAPLRGPRGAEGVLVVMSRHRRTFASQELRVLLAIAGIAQALRQQSHGRDGMRSRIADLSRRAEAAERVQGTADALSMALLRGHSVDRALAVASDVLGARLQVEGLPTPGPSTYEPQEAEDSPALGMAVPIPGADRRQLAAEGAVQEGPLHTLAQIVALNFARQRASVETEIRLTDHFVHSLLTADTEELSRLWRRSSLLGMDLEVPRAIVCLGENRPADRPLLDRIQREMRARTLNGQITTYDGDVILLWPVPDTAAAERLPDQIREVVAACRPRRLTAGIGPVCRGADDYHGAAREAMFARQVAAYSSSGRQVAVSADLGMYRLFAHIGGIAALRSTVLETLGPLIQTDERTGSDLVHTLRVYLERDRRIAETARALHVHVNTLRYRIERIGKLLDVELDDAESRFFVSLALRLLPVVGVDGQ
ncbi:helix-turn-helix domain-containing protein [Spirillospora sp. CA-255316]